jgi:uncharacterized protein YhaN
MKLRSISFHHVGPHNGPVVCDLGDGLTIVYGRNEAGKSTLLAGLRGLLFGRVNSGEPQLVLGREAHGVLEWEKMVDEHPNLGPGRAASADQKGVAESWPPGRYRLERALDRRRQPVLYTPDGQRRVGDAELRQALPELAGVDDIIYQSVFTFQLAELGDLAEHAGSLADKLYAIGRLGLQSPAAVEAELVHRAKALFNPDPRARRPELTRCLQELADLVQQKRQAGDTVADYQATQAELERLQAEKAAQAEALAALRQERSDWQRLQALWPLRQRLAAAHSELVRCVAQAGLPVNPHGSAGDQQAARAIAEGDTALLEVAAATEEASSETAELDGAAPETVNELDAPVRQSSVGADVSGELDSLEQTAVIQARRLRAWLNEAAGMAAGLEHAARLADEAAQLRQRIAAARQDLSALWDEQRLSQCNLGRSFFERVRAAVVEDEQRQRAIDVQRQALAQAAATLQRREEMLRDRGWDPAKLPSALAVRRQECEREQQWLLADGERLQAMADKLRELATLADEQALLAAQVEADEQTAATPGARTWVLVASGLLVSVLAAVERAWLASVASGIAALAGLASDWWLRQRRRHAHRAREQRPPRWRHLEQRADALRQQLRELQASLQTVRVSSLEETKLASAVADVKARTRLCDESLRQLAADEQLYRDWQDARLAYTSAQRAVEEAAAAAQAHRLEFSTWLERQGFPRVDLPPGAFLSECQVARDLREHIVALAAKEQETVILVRKAQEFLAGDAQGRRHPSGTARRIDPSAMANRPVHAAPTPTEGTAGYISDSPGVPAATIAATMAELTAARQRYERQLEQLESALAEWRRAYTEAVSLCGDAAAWTDAMHSLQGESEASLAERIDELDRQLAEATTAYETLVKQVGEVEARLRNWSRHSSELDWRLAAARRRRTELAREWAVYKLAAALLKEARRNYEAERQPRALRLAADILERATAGRYTALRATADDAGRPRLMVVDKHGREWDPATLSRGTREIVYLALRLALIRDYRARGVELPVVLDDPMVNLDPHRLREFFEVLRQEAKEQQLLYMTCHPALVELAAGVQGVDVKELRSQ